MTEEPKGDYRLDILKFFMKRIIEGKIYQKEL